MNVYDLHANFSPFLFFFFCLAACLNTKCALTVTLCKMYSFAPIPRCFICDMQLRGYTPCNQFDANAIKTVWTNYLFFFNIKCTVARRKGGKRVWFAGARESFSGCLPPAKPSTCAL
uniref:Putative secreted protein n=1 Tax=Amblyomma triste TaxID=251400 RepID=A0A023G1S1_AMBTT